MSLNRAGQVSPGTAGIDPLRQRLAGLSKTGAEGGDTGRGDRDSLGDLARSQLRGPKRKPGAGDAEAKDRASAKSWPLWIIFDILLLLLAVPLAVVAPPLMDCRTRQQEVGFFAGHSFETCARDGMRERWELLDARLKMLVRGSGR